MGSRVWLVALCAQIMYTAGTKEECKLQPQLVRKKSVSYSQAQRDVDKQTVKVASSASAPWSTGYGPTKKGKGCDDVAEWEGIPHRVLAFVGFSSAWNCNHYEDNLDACEETYSLRPGKVSGRESNMTARQACCNCGGGVSPGQRPFTVATEAGCLSQDRYSCPPKGSMVETVQLGVCNKCDDHKFEAKKGEALNQDGWLAHCSESRCVYVVVDGHGKGSEFVTQGFIKKLNAKLEDSKLTIDKDGKWIQGIVDDYDQDLSRAGQDLGRRKRGQQPRGKGVSSQGVSSQGGCALAGAVVVNGGAEVHVFHAGDSRVLVAFDNGTLAHATQDHGWDQPTERARAELKKGKLYRDNGGNLRLEILGLMPSRGIGDIAAKEGTGGLPASESGFSSKVEYKVLSEPGRLGKIVVGSDGVFDEIASKWGSECQQSPEKANDEVIKVVMSGNAASLVKKSRVRMEGYTRVCDGNPYVDDITAIVVNVKSSVDHLDDTAHL